MKKLFSALMVALLLPIASAWAQDYSDGNGYTTIKNPVRTANPDKVEVVEIFWYGCPHCYSLDPITQAWKKTIADDVDFKYMPAVFGRNWLAHAKAFHVADILGVEEKLHADLFNAIHQDHKRMNSEDELAEFFTNYGVSEDEFRKQYNSFAVNSRLSQADAKIRAYGARGVPGLIVNGKYLVTAATAGGNNNIYSVVDYLIEQERQASK
ncbi:MAG: disulfide bond formation protein DsbA [Marinomonas sp.]|jgi:thiol:disulfide interchange protein DsbA|uniref:Thiol:disulfide interchange protein n=1 Tax=Marinomonas communis TaxID=28254 RepID=A0A4V3DG49_9GAMM|nr:thiol:disulfide interchange protein DsbA/DsbL [Marinomonas communis]MAF16672.1 disulfide bond formation protein DsbA [Marinomonas sp.]MCC4275375.1 thiol:disulfide interchange protein DsbA/DsbL [Marinomonas communis]RUM49786.1 MAG: thiol:disulfide interchange protein DsbA/DsbL [Marinomonas sp.]RUM53070.1 MAG: thiol:disulfide interchange protein DsbA/DsbL [Marinomonas sp.]TDR13041.1 thiol:disulfide interchange protein DsbA [Marinomonas communis]|tara:strand:+ start:91 stop:720 length:630 start_codon:yes stop_codon:yes gene_type:complete